MAGGRLPPHSDVPCCSKETGWVEHQNIRLSTLPLPQALYGDLPDDTKIASEVKSQKALLKLAGTEPALQLAQLVALEHLLGVTLPERTKEVGTLSYV